MQSAIPCNCFQLLFKIKTSQNICLSDIGSWTSNKINNLKQYAFRKPRIAPALGEGKHRDCLHWFANLARQSQQWAELCAACQKPQARSIMRFVSWPRPQNANRGDIQLLSWHGTIRIFVHVSEKDSRYLLWLAGMTCMDLMYQFYSPYFPYKSSADDVQVSHASFRFFLPFLLFIPVIRFSNSSTSFDKCIIVRQTVSDGNIPDENRAHFSHFPRCSVFPCKNLPHCKL